MSHLPGCLQNSRVLTTEWELIEESTHDPHSRGLAFNNKSHDHRGGHLDSPPRTKEQTFPLRGSTGSQELCRARKPVPLFAQSHTQVALLAEGTVGT
jgi:hypothetical protein